MPRATTRFLKALIVFLPLAVTLLRDRKKFLIFGPKRKLTQEQRKARSKRLRSSFERLGTTYIKLGQLLSTRPDIVPTEYAEEMTKLQDEVPPDDYKHIEPILKEELGDPDEVFDYFRREAISGASIAQVHKASYNDEKVAVKIRRPKVKGLVEADLTVLDFLLPFAQMLVRIFGDRTHAESMEGLADDFELRIRQEMNFERERRMISEIRSNMQKDPKYNSWVCIPEPFDDVCTVKILTLSYEDGVKITNVEELRKRGHNTTELARRLEKIYLKMALIDGVYHGDPHPGNLAVNDEGQIVIYDFGMSGRLSSSLQDAFFDFYYSIGNEDPGGIMDAMIDMGILDPDIDRELMEEVLDVAIQDLSGDTVDEFRVQRLMEEIDNVMYEYPVRIPQHISLGLRVATISEGVCITLDPDFDFTVVVMEFFMEQGYTEKHIRGRIEKIWSGIEETIESIIKTPNKFEGGLEKVDRDEFEVGVDLESSREHIDRLGKRISYSIVAGSSLIGGSVLFAVGNSLAFPLFIFGLLVFYLVYKSFSYKIPLGPRYYATRHRTEGKNGSKRDYFRREKTDEENPNKPEKQERDRE